MKNRKKGQVALEFLMTYGWAFLIILVVIGAFIYFDVLNPQRAIAGRCTMTAGLYCNAYAITATGIQFEVRNDLGRTIQNLDGEITGTLPESNDLTCTVAPASIGAGELAVFTCNGAPVSGGERYQGDISLTYNFVGSGIDQTHPGGISGSTT